MKRKRFLAVILCLLLALTGCAPAAQDASAFAPEETERLVLYTAHKKEVWWPIVKEFETRTGVWVEVVEGGTNELLERLDDEKDAPAADVMFGGGVESLESYRALFSPYICRDAAQILPQYRAADDLWTPFSSLPVVLVYNPKLLAPGRLNGWADLLDPALRGEIAFADPAVSGSSYTALVTMLCALPDDTDTILQDFAANLDGRVLSGSGEIISAVANGEAWVGITLEETARKRIAAGDGIAMVYPSDGTSCVPDGCAIVAGAPHRANAEAFVDFAVSRDVQQLLQTDFYRRSVRSDVEPASQLPPLGQLAQIDYDVSWASENRDAILMSWAFYLGTEPDA